MTKIKTKIERIFDVKPVTGCIPPGEKVVINFKASNPIVNREIDRAKLNILIYSKNCNF